MLRRRTYARAISGDAVAAICYGFFDNTLQHVGTAFVQTERCTPLQLVCW
jgi:hypothetical protein